MRLVLSTVVALLLASCAHHNSSSMSKAHINGEKAMDTYLASNSKLKKHHDDAIAYVVYPHVGKGGVGVGGAYGKGEVFEKGVTGYHLVGYSELTQVSVGLELGGKTFGEIVFFDDKDSFAHFKKGGLEMSAEASAVALKKGAAEIVSQTDGYTVVILNQKGLMGELSIGGQKLSFIER